MIIPGLVSVTFRKLSPQEIIPLVQQAGLRAVEWGGDIHVPHGDRKQAHAVRDWTLAAGLDVAAYGSYYRIWPEEPVPFEPVLETALELGAPVIRVWAGKLGSQAAGPRERASVAAGARKIAERAQQAGVKVALEYHGGTLTDTSESAEQLLREVDHPNLVSYWQPPTLLDSAERQRGLEAVLPWLCSLHVFQWESGPGGETVRLPLQAGADEWQGYFSTAARTDQNFYALLEFVREDSPAAFLEDAQTLSRLISTLNNGSV